MQKKKINYGIVGTGHIGKYHIQQIQNIENINLVGVFDTHTKLCSKIANEYKVRPFEKLESLLAKCDAISVATPAYSHYQVAKQALSAHCHVFIEKPITTNIQDAKKLISLSKKNKLLIQVGHIERFNPALAAFTKKQKDIKPQFIETHRLAPFNIRGTDTDVILDLMIHDIDLVLYLANSKVVDIVASGVSVLSNSLDMANARISFDSGCVANLTASRISDKPLRKLRVFEKSRYLSFDLQNNTYSEYLVKNNRKNTQTAQLVFEKDNKVVTMKKHIGEKTNALYEELLSFVNSIIKSQKVMVNAIDGKNAIEIALLVQKQINAQQK
jgi:predicted dehydrogenase